MQVSATVDKNQSIHKSPKYLTVQQFSLNNPAFTQASLRNLIFKSNRRQSTQGIIKGNGLIESGAVVRIGRKVLIHEERFFHWIESHNNLNDYI